MKILLLKNEVNSLRNNLTLFIKSTKTFQKIIGSQVEMSNHTGLGFSYQKNFHSMTKKDIMNLCASIRKEHSLQHKERTFIKKCTFCKRSGHLDVDCFLKIQNLELLKTNKEGPTDSRVPKKPLTQNAGILSKCKEKAMVLGHWLF